MKTEIISFKAGVTECFIIGNENRVLIDTGIYLSEDEFKEVLAENSVDPKQIKLIIITHGHIDHYANIAYMKKMTGAKVLCHRECAGPIRSGVSSVVVPANLMGKILMRIFNATDENYVPVEPDILIDDEFDLAGYGIAGKAVYTPGHTDCSLSVITDEGVAFTGDLLLPNPLSPEKPVSAVFAADKNKVLSSIELVSDSGAGLVYGSHGGVFTAAELRRLVLKLKRKYKK